MQYLNNIQYRYVHMIYIYITRLQVWILCGLFSVSPRFPVAYKVWSFSTPSQKAKLQEASSSADASIMLFSASR